MTTTAIQPQEPMTITEEIFVRASIEKTFASLLAQMGRLNETPDGAPLPMILEPFPGGRWYRDLGGENGHLWAFVQSIKRPTLLELWGPLFLSTAATSNLQYRLKEVDGGTMIAFHHKLVGPPPGENVARMGSGWTALHARVRAAAESGSDD